MNLSAIRGAYTKTYTPSADVTPWRTVPVLQLIKYERASLSQYGRFLSAIAFCISIYNYTLIWLAGRCNPVKAMH